MIAVRTDYDCSSLHLQDMAEMGAVTPTGERRYTRYWLKLEGTSP